MSKRIRIKISSRDYRLLDKSAISIARAARATGVDVKGPIPFPTTIKKFTVIKSPHKHKKSREQFEYRTYSRLIDIINPASSTVESLTMLDMSSSVDIKIDIDK